MTDYGFILAKKYAGKSFVLRGDEYEGLEWMDSSPKPTKAQLDQEYIDYKAANDYIAKRAAEYPKLEDQLDTIYHKGIDAWKAEIATIKAKYPKPE